MTDALQVASHSNHGSKKRKQEVGGAGCEQHTTQKKLKLQIKSSADPCHLAAPPHHKQQRGAACGIRPAPAAAAGTDADALAPSCAPARDHKQPAAVAAAAGGRAAARGSKEASRAAAAARAKGQEADTRGIPQPKHQQQQCDLLQRVARLTGSLGGTQAQQNNAAKAVPGTKHYVMQNKKTCVRPRW